jgi:hypothetical protein
MDFTVSETISVSLLQDSRRYLFFASLSDTSKQIPHVRIVVESSLYALGDGNCKMREGIQVGKGVKTQEVDHSSIIDFVRESSPFPPSIIELKEL